MYKEDEQSSVQLSLVSLRVADICWYIMLLMYPYAILGIHLQETLWCTCCRFCRAQMDWSLIRNSVLAVYFFCLISAYTFPPSIHHIVKKDRHRRQTSWRKEIAWCSSPVFLLLWDEPCVLEIEFRKREETIPCFFFSYLFLYLLYLLFFPHLVNNYCWKSLMLFSHKLFSNLKKKKKTNPLREKEKNN